MLKTYFKNAGILAVTEIIMKMKGFIFMPFLTRHFGTVNYGVWSQVSVIVGTITPLIVLGTDSALMRYIPGLPLEQQKRIFSARLVFLGIVSLAVCSLVFAFKHQILLLFFGTDNPEYMAYIPLVVLTVLTGLANSTFLLWFRINNDAKLISLTTILSSLLNIAATVLILVEKKGVFQLVLLSLVGDLLLMLYYIYKISKQYGWAKPDFAWIKTIIAYGLPLVLGAYAMWGLNTLNRIFLVKYCTLSDVGIFSVAFSLGHMFIQVIINPLWTMYPNSAASLYNIGHHEKLQQLFNSTAGLMVFLSFPAIALLTVLGKPFITVFASTSFSGAGPLISIITAAYVFHILASFYSISLGFVNKQFMDTIAICIACVINVVLNILLIPRYGIIGAAGATCLGFLVQLVVVFISAKLVTQLYTNFRFISKVFTISLVMGFSIYFIRERVAMGNISQLIILSLSGVIIYSLLALSMGLVRTEEIKRMFYKTSN